MMVDVEDWRVAWNPDSELLLIVVVVVVDTAYVDDARYCCLVGDWRAAGGAGRDGVNNRPAEAEALSLRSSSSRRTSAL